MFKSLFCLSFKLILPVLCYVSVSDQASGDSGIGVAPQSHFATVDKTFTTTTTRSNTTHITTQTSEISTGSTSVISALSGIEDSDSLNSLTTRPVSVTDAGNTTVVTATIPQSSASSSTTSSGLTLLLEASTRAQLTQLR
jgi:hypothetical protein